MAAPLVPFLMVLATAGGLFVLAAVHPRRHRLAAALAWAGVIGSVIACLCLWGHRLNALGWVISDGLGQFLNLLILTGLVLTLPVLGRERKRLELEVSSYPKLCGWFFISTAGLMLMTSTRNLAVVFVCFELASVGSLALSGRTRVGSNRPGRRFEGFFSVGNLAGSILMFLGLALCFFVLKTVDLAGMESVLASRPSEIGVLPAAALSFFTVGLFLKLTMVVVRLVAPGQSASGPVAFLSILTQVAVIGVLLRSTGWLLTLAEPGALLLGWLSALGMIVGNLLAVRESDPGRILALGGLAQIGYLAMGLVVGGAAARSSVLLYLLVYTFMSLGALSVASSTGNGSEDWRWRGLAWTHPFLGWAMSLFLASLAGLPPTAGLVARFYLLGAVVAADRILLLAVALIGSLLGAFCYMRIFLTLYRQAPASKQEDQPRRLSWKVSLLITSSVVLLAGIWPEPLLVLVRRLALEFF